MYVVLATAYSLAQVQIDGTAVLTVLVGAAIVSTVAAIVGLIKHAGNEGIHVTPEEKSSTVERIASLERNDHFFEKMHASVLADIQEARKDRRAQQEEIRKLNEAAGLARSELTLALGQLAETNKELHAFVADVKKLVQRANGDAE